MKKVILSILLTLNYFNLFSQSLSRSNDAKVEITEISKLEYAKGYRYLDGDWISFDYKKNKSLEEGLNFNAIPNKYFFYSTGDYSKYSLSNSINFGSIRLVNAIYNGENTLIIHFNKVSGKYKYPSIREDWYEFTEDHILVVSNDDVQRIKSIFPEKINEAFRVEFKLSQNDSFRSDIDKGTFEDNVRKVLNQKVSSYKNEYLFFEIFPINIQEGKFVRFNFKRETSFSEELKEFDPLIFDKYYFEADYDDFNTFIMSF